VDLVLHMSSPSRAPSNSYSPRPFTVNQRGMLRALSVRLTSHRRHDEISDCSLYVLPPVFAQASLPTSCPRFKCVQVPNVPTLPATIRNDEVSVTGGARAYLELLSYGDLLSCVFIQQPTFDIHALDSRGAQNKGCLRQSEGDMQQHLQHCAYQCTAYMRPATIIATPRIHHARSQGVC